jgi:hypothetical protein
MCAGCIIIAIIIGGGSGGRKLDDDNCCGSFRRGRHIWNNNVDEDPTVWRSIEEEPFEEYDDFRTAADVNGGGSKARRGAGPHHFRDERTLVGGIGANVILKTAATTRRDSFDDDNDDDQCSSFNNDDVANHIISSSSSSNDYQSSAAVCQASVVAAT